MIDEHDGSRERVMKLLWIFQPYRSVNIWAAEWRMTLDQVESTLARDDLAEATSVLRKVSLHGSLYGDTGHIVVYTMATALSG